MKLSKILNYFQIHLFLFGIYPVLLLFSVNIGEANFRDVIFSSLTICLIQFFLFLIINKKTKNALKSNLILSLITCLTFSYGPIFNLLGSYSHNEQTINIIIATCTVFIFFVGLWIIKESNLNLVATSKLCNIFSFTLVLTSLVSIFNETKKLPSKKNYQQIRNEVFGFKKPINPSSSKLDNLPNIYFFVFDRYANNEVLSESYNFDNQPFTNFLKTNGFNVKSKTFSNYPKTIYSLSSTLNLSYINEFFKSNSAKQGSIYPLIQVIQNNNAFSYLKKIGYTVSHYGSWWAPTREIKAANINVNYSFLNEFNLSLIKTNLLFTFCRDLIFSYEQWSRIKKQFHSLHESLYSNKPSFSYIHMTIPHPPAVFHSNGKLKGPITRRKFSEEDNYIEQIKYVNLELKKFITAALKEKPHPIIIVQADEGPRPKRFYTGENIPSWTKATNKEIRKKLGIINAFYFPNIKEENLPSELTPTNTFRILFNLYYDENLPILEEKYFIEESTKNKELNLLEVNKRKLIN